MQNRISDTTERLDQKDDEPQPIGDILGELLAQYEAKFSGIHVSVVETAATAV